MRQIGELQHESQARVFRAYLISHGVNNDVDAGRNGMWAVWVHDEDKLDLAKKEFADFVADPKNAKFRAGAREGEEREREEIKEAKKSRAEVVDMRTRWGAGHIARAGVVTVALVVLSIVVTALMYLPNNQVQQWLSISSFSRMGSMVGWHSGFPEIMHGQVWRLITPIFMHFGILHILFNMAWLYQLGGLIESREGSWIMVAQVVVFGIAGNVLQFYLAGPSFGGMSGVVYGLFAYIWIMGRYGNVSGYQLDQTTVIIMIAWFFLCLAGVVGNVANGAHGAGLVLGVVWACVKMNRIPFLPRR